MKYFTSRYKRVLFVVLSDDIPWCRQNVRGKDVVYSNNSPSVDLAIASLCDHAIITVGTFGLWVAWFADGITVRSADVPANNSWIYNALKNETHFFPRNSVII